MPPNPTSPLLALSAAIALVLEGSTASATPIQASLENAFRRESPEPDSDASPLLLVPPQVDATFFLSHRSHRSHRSHSSHYSGSSGYRSYRTHHSGGGPSYQSEPAPAPTPVRPARVSFVVYPGGRITVDNLFVGTDTSPVITLQPGSHEVRIENVFLGSTARTITVSEGQTGVLVVEW